MSRKEPAPEEVLASDPSGAKVGGCHRHATMQIMSQIHPGCNMQLKALRLGLLAALNLSILSWPCFDSNRSGDCTDYRQQLLEVQVA